MCRMSFPEILNLNHLIDKDGPPDDDLQLSVDGCSEGELTHAHCLLIQLVQGVRAYICSVPCSPLCWLTLHVWKVTFIQVKCGTFAAVQ